MSNTKSNYFQNENLNNFTSNSSSIKNILFSITSPKMIKAQSIMRVSNPNSFDDFGHAVRNGLYDARLGPSDPRENRICPTCSLSFQFCPGHCGHIELSAPVYHPLLFNSMFSLLNRVCFHCHSFRQATRIDVALLQAKIELIRTGAFDSVNDLSLLFKRKLEKAQKKLLKKYNGINKKIKSIMRNDPGIEAEMLKVIDKFMRKQDGIINSSCDNVKIFNHFVPKQRELIQQLLKNEISSFFESLGKGYTCVNCHGIARKLRHDKENTKIFQFPLDDKILKRMKKNPDLHISESSHVIDTLNLKNSNIFEDSIVPSVDETEDDDLGFSSGNEIMDYDEPEKNSVYVTPLEALIHLENLWKRESDILDEIFGSYSPILEFNNELDSLSRISSPHMFFIEFLTVTPSRFRPLRMLDGIQFEHQQTILYSRILDASHRFQMLTASRPSTPSSYERNSRSPSFSAIDLTKKLGFSASLDSWIELQIAVNSLMLGEKKINGEIIQPGLKQDLEKKEGLFRKNMMGKRVNFAARSVISPDPYIGSNEIGVPEVFAKTLTYPTPVNAHNVNEMRQAVINGPDVYPGAVYLIDGERVLKLGSLSKDARILLAKSLFNKNQNTTKKKVVLRHMRDGDIVLMNRQPTLHRPGMMAHRTRILKGEKTIRMHYANCSTYNADFDGDEMNMHFPQSENARAEAYTIMETDKQYLVPSSGRPIRGLIQDHVVMGVILTKRDTFLNKEQYQHLLYGCLDDFIKNTRFNILPPTIMKPEPLWTGKQLISNVLTQLTLGKPGLNLTSKSKIKGKLWNSGEEEGHVLFQNNEMLTGILGKTQFGAAPYGLVNMVYEVYSPNLAGKILSALGRLFTMFLQMTAFSCGVDDMIVSSKGDDERSEKLDSINEETEKAAKEFVLMKSNDVDIESLSDIDVLKEKVQKCLESKADVADFDTISKSFVNPVASDTVNTLLPNFQVKPFPINNLQLMTTSGAKGSLVNQSQISCLLGQQELEGMRVPRMANGRTLPCFPKYDLSARAGGFVAQRFVSGIEPQEYFFHCMAGREGLVDTAVKTSRSGYLQRCCIKHLESLKVEYDNTIRSSDGSVYQFLYGGDGISVSHVLSLNNISLLGQNIKGLSDRLSYESSLEYIDTNSVNNHLESNPDSDEPLLHKFNPSLHLGAVSEVFAKKVDDYISKDPDSLLKRYESIPMSKKKSRSRKSKKKNVSNVSVAPVNGTVNNFSKEEFKKFAYFKYLSSIVEPGEPVGLLAAQSIGEPSTQLTLNTFHLAGVGGANVTLGIPRLREIIMTASKSAKTPIITIPFKSHINREIAELLAARMNPVFFSEFVNEISVQTGIGVTGNDEYSAVLGKHARYTTISFDISGIESLLKQKGVSLDEIISAFERNFVPSLMRVVKAQLSNEKIPTNFDIPETSKIPENDIIDVEENNDKKEEDDKSDESEAEERSDFSESESESDIEMNSNSSNIEDDYSNTNTDIEDTTGFDEYKENLISKYRELKDFAFDMKKKCLVVELVFPMNARKLLISTISEELSEQVKIRNVKGVTRVSVIDGKNNNISLQVEGNNFKHVFLNSDMLVLDKLYSNDVGGVLRTYGVEAAASSILTEIRNVFEVYGISVDPHHLSLISDYMTFLGGFRALNRGGITSNSSPLLKMSFETSFQFLVDAVLTGSFDDMSSHSAKVVAGAISSTGSGMIDLLYDPVQLKL